MQGHKILLENRQQDQQKTISRNNDKYGYEFASEITHNYEFSFKRKSSSGPTECKQTELNIKQLELPNSLAQNHQPNKLFKCLKKRRNRLGFTIKPIVHNCTQEKQQKQKHNERNDDDYIDAMECQNNEEMQDDHSHYRNDYDDDDDDDDIDFDFDVQRLIWLREESMVNDNNNATADGNNGGNKKNKHHHNKNKKNKKNKMENNNNNKKTKKITFSLSRPQSPRTVQVIRVDVTTNCYPSEVDDSISSSTSATTMNNNNNSDNDYYSQRYRRRYGFGGDGNTKQTNSLPATANKHGKKTAVDGRTMMMMEGPRSANCDKSNDRDDFTILCRKLTLSPKGRRKFV